MLPFLNKHALLGALSLLLLSACEKTSSPVSPGGEDQATLDLRTLATKVSYLGSPLGSILSPGASATPDPAESGLGKKSSDTGTCEGVTIEEGKDTTAYGGVGSIRTKTSRFDSSGKIECDGFQEPAWEIVEYYAKDTLTESWTTYRLTFGKGYALSVNGSGRIHYSSGYDIAVDTLIFLQDSILRPSIPLYILGLENGRYHVPLAVAPGIDLLAMDDLSPDAVLFTGPIIGTSGTVGYFEILGSGRVVIRDAAKKIIATH